MKAKEFGHIKKHKQYERTSRALIKEAESKSFLLLSYSVNSPETKMTGSFYVFHSKDIQAEYHSPRGGGFPLWGDRRLQSLMQKETLGKEREDKSLTECDIC